MDAMKSRRWLAAFGVAAIAVLATAGCSGGSAGSEDKAGGSGEPVVLRLANTNGQLDFAPAVVDFVDRVEELSGGELRIEAVDEWGDSAPDAEQQVVRDVSAGEIDLGWVGTRVFDTLDVKSFQALTAPMLVDSYALESAVIESGMTEQMLDGLEDLGVVGLGVLPDGLREAGRGDRTHSRPGGLAGDHLRHLDVEQPDRGDPRARSYARADLREGAG